MTSLKPMRDSGSSDKFQRERNQGMRLARRAVGNCVRQIAQIVPGHAAKCRVDVRRVNGNIRRHHRDIAWRQCGIVLKQLQQLIVQHLHFAQARVTNVELQRSIFLALLRPDSRLRRQQIENIALHAPQQRVAARLAGKIDLVARLHLLVGKQLRDKVAAGAAVRGQ